MGGHQSAVQAVGDATLAVASRNELSGAVARIASQVREEVVACFAGTAAGVGGGTGLAVRTAGQAGDVGNVAGSVVAVAGVADATGVVVRKERWGHSVAAGAVGASHVAREAARRTWNASATTDELARWTGDAPAGHCIIYVSRIACRA